MTQPDPVSIGRRLDDRYGRRDPRRRRVLVIALAALGGLLMVAVAALAWNQLTDPVSARLRTYEVASASTTEVTVDVYRRDGEPVRCEVYAQAADHAIVGEQVIEIPAGEPGNVVVSATITTERPAVNGVLRGCEVVD